MCAHARADAPYFFRRHRCAASRRFASCPRFAFLVLSLCAWSLSLSVCVPLLHVLSFSLLLSLFPPHAASRSPRKKNVGRKKNSAIVPEHSRTFEEAVSSAQCSQPLAAQLSCLLCSALLTAQLCSSHSSALLFSQLSSIKLSSAACCCFPVQLTQRRAKRERQKDRHRQKDTDRKTQTVRPRHRQSSVRQTETDRHTDTQTQSSVRQTETDRQRQTEHVDVPAETRIGGAAVIAATTTTADVRAGKRPRAPRLAAWRATTTTRLPMLRCRRRRRPFDSTAFRSSATLWTATVRDGAIADVRSRSRSLARAFTAPVCLTPRPLPRSSVVAPSRPPAPAKAVLHLRHGRGLSRPLGALYHVRDPQAQAARGGSGARRVRRFARGARS